MDYMRLIALALFFLGAVVLVIGIIVYITVLYLKKSNGEKDGVNR